MILSILVLLAAVCAQSNVVYSQQPQQSFGFNYPNPSQGYGSGFSWQDPYSAAASNSWVDYIKKAHDASHQLYKQWDKTGAEQMINLGMQYAQMAAKEFGKYSQQPNQAMGKIPFF